MSELKIEREHNLGLEGARAVAERWQERGQQQWGITCEVVRGESEDRIRFDHMGASGQLRVSDTRFDLHLKLGFLMGAYSGKIEEKIRAKLDEALGPAA